MRLKKTILFMGVISGLLLAYQNCSNVRLLPPKTVELQSISAEGSFCSLPAVDSSLQAHIIFVVDMSGSNMRSVVNNQYTHDGSSDLQGVRFQIISNFIQSACANNNPNNKFSVIGFSNEVLPRQIGCDRNRLVAASAAEAQVQSLRDLQDNEPLGPPTNMRSTMYERGVNCAYDIISDDIANTPANKKPTKYYHVMFLSDGQPTDSGGNTLGDPSAIFNRVRDLATLGKQAGGAALQTILYGADVLQQQGQAAYDSAVNTLGQMSSLGDTTDTTVTDPSTINFCDLFQAGKKTPYVVTNFGVINLTAHLKHGELKADSDMDGMVDEDEITLGFDPVKPRSGVNGNQVLDGYCKQSADKCAAFINCGTANALNFSSCEMTAFNVTDGLDSDRDGIPDLVELMKGTLLSKADSDNDVDGDGLVNAQEIARGRDANVWDSNLDLGLQMQYKHYLSSTPNPGCPSNQQSWRFKIDHIPLVQTLGVTALDSVSQGNDYLLHAKNDNVILVYYIVRQSNETQSGVGQLYGQFIKANSFGYNLTQFKKLGDIGAIP